MLLLLYLAGVPLVLLLWGSFRTGAPGQPGTHFTLANYLRAYGGHYIVALAGNSLAYGVGATVLALALGTALAWLVERTDIPFRGLIFLLAVVRLAVQNMIMVIAWILLLSPRIGVLNAVLAHLGVGPINIYSLGGMIWIEGIDKMPIAFLLASGAIRAMDPALEESAYAAGASLWTTLRRVTLPLAAPALLASALTVFMMAYESFEAPTLVGLPYGIHTFVSEIYVRTTTVPADLPLASTYGVAFFLVAALGLLLYQRAVARAERFASITGKGFRARRLELGRWRLPLGCATIAGLVVLYVLPLAVVLWAALLPFYQVPSWQALHHLSLDNFRTLAALGTPVTALKNSVILGVSAATQISLLTLIVAIALVRGRGKLARVVDVVSFLPIAFPGLVLAVSLIWVYLTLPIPVYGTLLLLLIAYVTRYMPFGMRFGQAALMQVHQELEEAATVPGAGWGATFRRITLPLVLPALAGGWIYLLVYCFRDAAVSIMLYQPGTETVSVIVFNLWNNGQIGVAGAMAVTIFAALALAVGLGQRLGGRYRLNV